MFLLPCPLSGALSCLRGPILSLGSYPLSGLLPCPNGPILSPGSYTLSGVLSSLRGPILSPGSYPLSRVLYSLRGPILSLGSYPLSRVLSCSKYSRGKSISNLSPPPPPEPVFLDIWTIAFTRKSEVWIETSVYGFLVEERLN